MKGAERMITRSDKHEAKSQRAGSRSAGTEGGTQVTVRERGGTGSRALAREDLLSASPFALMRRVAEDMDRMFESFGFGRGRFAPRWSDLPERFAEPELAVWAPDIEVFDREGQYVVRADLPGLRKEDVRVELTENALMLEGERRNEQEERREGFYRSERSYGRFSRVISLPEGVDTEKVEAEFKDGVLEVRLPAPRRQPQQRRQIEIRSA
jgi:HSP20 family protein